MSGRLLTATSRPNLVSWPRYTSPIPPLPSSSRISHDPNTVPRDRATANTPAIVHSENDRILVQLDGRTLPFVQSDSYRASEQDAQPTLALPVSVDRHRTRGLDYVAGIPPGHLVNNW